MMGNPLRLLLVEDSEDDAFLLVRSLQKSGYDVISERVETAIDLTQALDREPWDIVISDYVLPGFSARQALELVQGRGLDVPFIVVSGVMGEDSAVAIMRAGAHDYLLKDQLMRLVPAIERELREAEIRHEKRQAEAALRDGLEVLVQQRTAELEAANASLRQLAAIVEGSNDAILSTTIDGVIVSWNRGAETVYGYAASEALGQRLGDLLQPIDPLADASSMLPIAVASGIESQQRVHRRKNGALIDVSLTVSLMQDSAGETTGMSLIARDISEARAVEKMKDEFVSVVSHELRTPLTSIRASLGLLLMGKLGEVSAAGQQFLEIAVKNTDRLIRLINDILDLERLESGKLTIECKPCALAVLLHQAIATMEGMAAAANIKLEVVPLEVEIWADSDRILQTLTNLLSNAIKFSDSHTTIYLRAQQRDAKTVQIAVQDEGRGIPEEKLETIFGRFQQVDASDARQQGGTGLGLAICRSIVQQHGGTIWVESTIGVGSTFCLTLPIV